MLSQKARYAIRALMALHELTPGEHAQIAEVVRYVRSLPGR